MFGKSFMPLKDMSHDVFYENIPCPYSLESVALFITEYAKSYLLIQT